MLNDWFWRSPAMTLQIQRCVKTKHSQCLLFLSSSYAFVSKYTVPSIFKRGNGKSSIYRWFSHPDPSKTRIFQQFHCCRLHFNIFQHISCDWWFGTFLVFPYIGNIYIYNHPNWLSYFQRDRSVTNQSCSSHWPGFKDNFLVQCQGTKRVCLFPPEGHGQLYVNTKYDSGSRCCDVDVFNPVPWCKDGTTQSEPVGITGGFKH